MSVSNVNFAPLYRSTIGFDRIMRALEANVPGTSNATYPPYDIVAVTDDHYRVTMAIAGFGQEDVSVVAQGNRLTISGERNLKENRDAATSRYLHRGIGRRAFERRFDLADYVSVKDAWMENGLLHVDLVRTVPDALKPRTIAVGTTPGSGAQLPDQTAAGDSKAA